MFAQYTVGGSERLYGGGDFSVCINQALLQVAGVSDGCLVHALIPKFGSQPR